MRGSDSTEAAQGSPQSSRPSSFNFFFNFPFTLGEGIPGARSAAPKSAGASGARTHRVRIAALFGGGRTPRRAVSAAFVAVLLVTGLPDSSSAAPPKHPRKAALDVTGLNKACGAATDSEGDLYASSPGEGKIKVFAPADHETAIAEIADAHEPCALAVQSDGTLYASEQGTGEVVRYEPTAYPLSGTPSWEAAEVIDSSGEAKGISVDPYDDRLYVAEGTHVSVYDSQGELGANEVQTASFGNAVGGSFRLALPGEGEAGRDETQRVAIPSPFPSGGTFTLEFEGQTTAPIAYNKDTNTPDGPEVQAALEALSTIGAGNVSVIGYAKRGWWVTFTGALAETDVPSIEGHPEGLSGGSGTISVKALSDITEPIAYEAEPAEAEATLEALDGIGANNVSVQKSGTQFLISFVGELAGADVTLLTGDPSGLTSSEGPDPKFPPEANVSTTSEPWSGQIGEGELSEATGVAAYHRPSEGQGADSYLFVADEASDTVEVFAADNPNGPTLSELAHRTTIEGPAEGEPFQFGPAGTQLAADPGNALEDETLKCLPVGEQACTSGHLLLYDAGREAVEEFDAAGHYLDSFAAGLADAGPSALAIDRSGGATDGTIYVGSGAAAGAKLEAFGPLTAPYREARPALSHTLAGANAVATDRYGDLYAAAGSTVHVYGPEGTEITSFGLAKPTEEALAVDLGGRVYARCSEGKEETNKRVCYYTPSAYPPVEGTTYGSPTDIANTTAGALGFKLRAFALDPGNGRLYVAGSGKTAVLGTAGEGFPILDPCFACGLSGVGTARSIALGSGHELYAPTDASAGRPGVVDPTGGEIWARLAGAGSPLGLGLANAALAADYANGDLLAFNSARETAEEYDAAGAFVASFGAFTPLSKAEAIAVDNACALHEPPLDETTTPTCEEFDPANGTVYVAFDDTEKPYDVTAFGPLSYPEAIEEGEAPKAATESADELHTGGATLHGKVDPRGTEVEEFEAVPACAFQYLTEADFETNGESFAGAEEAPCAESAEAIGKGGNPVPVHAAIAGLETEVAYRYRLVASNEFGTGQGEAKSLTLSPPILEAKPALPIAYTEARLRGSVDPHGSPTTYSFEYLTQAEWEAGGESFAGAQSRTGALPAGEGPVAVSAALTGLAEGTSYRFRLAASNAVGEAEASEGPPFATLERPPPLECPNAEYRTGLSAKLPDCRAYELVTPAETRGASPFSGTGNYGSSGQGFNHWLSPPRGEGAGGRLSYFIEGILPGLEGNGRFSAYTARRGSGEHPAGGWASGLFSQTYAQAGGGKGSLRGVAADQEYALLEQGSAEGVEGALPFAVYLRTPAGFEILGRGNLPPYEDLNARGRFASPGGAHAIFTSRAHLEPEAPPPGVEAIYDRAAGSASAEVVSVAPEGAPSEVEEEFEADDAEYLAASEDGSTVAFRLGGTLYLHRHGATAQAAAAPNAFAGLAEDGSRMLYEHEGKLFAYDAASGESAEIAAGASFVSASPDAGAALIRTGLDLSLWDGAGTSFVGTLDPQDLVSFGVGSITVNLAHWPSNLSAAEGDVYFGRGNSPTRWSAEGGAFVFQSHARLTAYDNEGVGEVYRYDPAAPEAQRLACVSCDPTGAPPGGADAMLQVFQVEPSPGNTAGTPTDPLIQIPNLSDDGSRVVFQSADRLLPEDANQALNVYQWTAPGTHDCTRPGGCLALLSSGQGEGPSYLYGASASGSERLLHHDREAPRLRRPRQPLAL